MPEARDDRDHLRESILALVRDQDAQLLDVVIRVFGGAQRSNENTRRTRVRSARGPGTADRASAAPRRARS